MGNKHSMCDDLAILMASLSRSTTVFDLFCGMCSVVPALATSDRAVWGNDIQLYAATIADALLVSRHAPDSGLAGAVISAASTNKDYLTARFAAALHDERALLMTDSSARWLGAYRDWRHAANDAEIAVELASCRGKRGPYRLASLSFAYGYFGLAQCIEIDSLRYGIDTLHRDGLIDDEDARWAIVALLEAASRAASTPGHFAQFLQPKSHSAIRRIRAQRRRDIQSLFCEALSRLRPYLSQQWRLGNRVFNSDALAVWGELDAAGFREGIVYADPPYSREQYSRFYHVLETLTRYDYPDASGAGRYRDDRFSTPFSSRRTVRSAFAKLCQEVARRDSVLVLSYPQNGILSAAGYDVRDLLEDAFSHVELAHTARMTHSTMGGRVGKPVRSVAEEIWVAKP